MNPHTSGIRRTIKVYPNPGMPISKQTQDRLRHQAKGPVRKPHATLQVSVKTLKDEL